MELIKKVGETTIYKKRNGRFGVQNKRNNWINGDEKAKILAEAFQWDLHSHSPKPRFHKEGQVQPFSQIG